MKRVISFVLIILLVLFTGIPVFTSNLLCEEVYADGVIDDETTCNLAIATYYNSRHGYVTSGSVNPAIGIIANQVNAFFSDPENTTGINSYSDFATHITIHDNPFSVDVDYAGIIFLNNLVKYLCGKGKFPELYSGGSWGTGETQDELYDGYLYGDSLLYIITERNITINSANTFTSVKVGTPVNGVNSQFLYDTFLERNPTTDLETLNRQDNLSYFNIPCQYSQDITRNLYVLRAISSGNIPQSEMPSIFTGGIPVYSIRSDIVRGNACWFSTIDYPEVWYYGVVSYNYTTNKYRFSYFGSIERPSEPNTVNVAFETDDFIQSDTEGESITYTPKDTDNNTTFNTYNEYLTKYITKKTYIDNGSGEGGSGGTSPPWTGSNGGTATPDGNGGFNLNFPDLTLPDLDIDWSLKGLTEKFPFSIPFDLMAFFTVLNAEPQTPEIQATIPLGIWEWDIDWSLENFDGLASLLRNLEFIAFCIALLLITRSIIKG